jgi:hypothetical protein
MDVQYLIDIFELEGRALDAMVRNHPSLGPLFARGARGTDLDRLRRAYLGLLKLSADVTRYTVPALRAASQALRDGDDIDRRWSALFFSYASDETDSREDSGHHVWAREDMKALGAPAELLDAPVAPSAVLYATYFIDDAARHPYAILGAKGVLEHASLHGADDVARGIAASGLPNAENATRFFRSHGLLDIDHVRDGDRNLGLLDDPDKRRQVLEGAYVTTGTYRALIHYLLPT